MMIKLDPITERSVMKSTAVHTLMIGLFEMHKEKFDVFKKSFIFRFNWDCVVFVMLKSVMLIMLCLIFNLVEDQRNF